MTKKELKELWNSIDDDTEIVFPFISYKKGNKIKKIIIITE